jgi:hypothetical protein
MIDPYHGPLLLISDIQVALLLIPCVAQQSSTARRCKYIFKTKRRPNVTVDAHVGAKARREDHSPDAI